MMEWQTGIHTCNKHEMTLQVVFTCNKKVGGKNNNYLLIIDYRCEKAVRKTNNQKTNIHSNIKLTLQEIQIVLVQQASLLANIQHEPSEALCSIITLPKPACGHKLAMTAAPPQGREALTHAHTADQQWPVGGGVWRLAKLFITTEIFHIPL